jgi:hypothetical protein
VYLFDEELLVPLAALAIPIVAIAGWMLARVIRTISAHRLVEAALRERVALIAHGMDPSRLPAANVCVGLGMDAVGYDRHRAQGLLVWGAALLAGGASFALITGWLDSWGDGDWPLGVVAASIGVALLLGSAIVWPRGRR